MKTIALAAERQPGFSLSSKILVIATIIALLWAFIPAVSVFAAPGNDDQPWENIDLEKEWKNKLLHLRTAGFFYDHVRLSPADFEKNADLALAQLYLDKYGFSLKQANTVVFNHYGFDFQGNVTNEKQAYETIHDLAMYLQMMRGFREKMDAVPGGR
jgi:hypothetical protein